MNTAETAPKYSIFIKQAINYIDEHLTDDMTLETIAESVHSNASYLSRIFKKGSWNFCHHLYYRFKNQESKRPVRALGFKNV